MKKNVMKAIVAGLTSISMLAGSMTVMAKSYPDSQPGAWYHQAVDYVSERGIMMGYENGDFGAVDNLARGQFVTMIYRTEGSPDVEYKDTFLDVPDGQFFSIPAIWGHDASIITGYEDGNFGASDKLTREQLVTMLYRFAASDLYNTNDRNDLSEFPDKDSVSAFAQEAMQWGVAVGIISGDQGKINPQGDASRAQAATMIERFQLFVEVQENHVHQWGERLMTIDGVETECEVCAGCGNIKE